MFSPCGRGCIMPYQVADIGFPNVVPVPWSWMWTSVKVAGTVTTVYFSPCHRTGRLALQCHCAVQWQADLWFCDRVTVCARHYVPYVSAGIWNTCDTCKLEGENRNWRAAPLAEEEAMKIERNIYDTAEVKAKLYIDLKGSQMSTALPPAEQCL